MESLAIKNTDYPSAYNSPVFETSDNRLNKIWIELQKVQVEFSFAQELMMYHISPHWANAKTVVELGSGTGYHLGRLADRFPDKSYSAIDISPELTAYARQNEPQIDHFQACDVYKLEGHYDFCILRLFLQHLPDTDQVLTKIAEVTNPGGAILVIDSDDSERLYDPPVPRFMQFFNEYTSRETGKGRRRNVKSSVMQAMRGNKDWHIAKASNFVIPSTIDNNLHLLRRTYTLFMEMQSICEQMKGFDLNPAIEEWREWCALDNVYTQVGLTALLLERL